VDVVPSSKLLVPGSQRLYLPVRILTGGGVVIVVECGDTKITLTCEEAPKGRVTFRLQQVLVAPQFGAIIISGHRWFVRGGTIQGNKLVGPDGQAVTTFDFARGGFFLTTATRDASAVPAITMRTEVSKELVQRVRLQHRRMGHPSTEILAQATKMTRGLDITAQQVRNADHACSVCDLTKSLRYAPKLPQARAEAPGRCVHLDMASNVPVSQRGNRYIVVGTDDYSRWRKIYHAKSKVDGARVAMDILKEFAGDAGFYPAYCRFDNGTDINVN
jgi:hypothetical protein